MEIASYLVLETLKSSLLQGIGRDIARCMERNENLQDLKTAICDLRLSCPELEFIAHRKYLDRCSTTDCMKQYPSYRQMVTMTFKPDSKIQQLMIPSIKLGNLFVAGHKPKDEFSGNTILNVLNKQMYTVKAGDDS
ncbi:hypothetical protein DPMN_119554 [Dreissena polymorpha]|uniref:Uncharacterized protein n=1 Tax=Dreissena polymorpha TaxID=45954 RepID=A0A9D4JPH9_DREPO|nr:hypothetical protein DPMN_119554 [Dreissena polymorpha]